MQQNQKKEIEIVPNKVKDQEVNSNHFGKNEFWENYYLTNVEPFDWYQDFDGVKDIITQYIAKGNEILNIGCGTSSLSEEMYKEGYKNITNVDFSENCIRIMLERYQNYESSFNYAIIDARDMSNFKDGQFDVVIDKGCLDCVLCGEYSMQNSKKMLSEVCRVLKDTGIYICISYGDDGTVFDEEKGEKETPGPRKPILLRPEFDWKLKNTYKIYKHNIEEDDILSDEEPPKEDGKEEKFMTERQNKKKQKHKKFYNWENYHYVYVLKKGEALLSPGNLSKKSHYRFQ